jgi:retron-type reverse transcriptase
LAARGLPVVYSVEHLAAKRRMSEKQLRWMARNSRLFYKEFKIPKANGESRIILAPQGRLLTQQRWILRKMLDRATPHKYACGFVKGRSILDNARPHVGRKVVIRIDLQDFFPSISHRQVRKVFEQLGYPYRVASLLANLCTVDGFLPQGAPTSPAISNMVCGKLDRRFAGLKEKLKFRYSRYADDLVFSSDDDRLPNLIPFFKQVLREEGFAVNQGKIRIMRQGQKQKVTGIVVNQKTSVDREHVRRLRAAVHRLKTQGPEAVDIKTRPGRERDPLYVLRGHLSFVRMVRGGSCFAWRLRRTSGGWLTCPP